MLQCRVTSEPPSSDTSVDVDAALVSRAQAGDFSAFTDIVEQYQDRVYRLAYGMTRNDSDAQEVVQDTFMNVFRSLPKFRGEARLSSWIYRIGANAALMRLRSKKRKPASPSENATTGAPIAAQADRALWPVGEWAKRPDELLLNQELAEVIEGLFNSLPTTDRLVLLLRDVEGESAKQVAETLELTVPAVKSRLHRARLVVRQGIERYFNEAAK